MKLNFKDIHVGQMIKQLVSDRQIDPVRIARFLKINEDDLELMYQAKSMDTELLLLWSKLLEYDFFRVYSQHLLLYAPFGEPTQKSKKNTSLPQFRKKLYTPEIIEFIVELIEKKKKTPQEVIKDYRIPKTTLYKWMKKHKRND